jgi:hypothetical protein
MIEDVYVEFTLVRKAGEREIAGADKTGNGINRIMAKAEVEFGVKRMAKEQFYNDVFVSRTMKGDEL